MGDLALFAQKARDALLAAGALCEEVGLRKAAQGDGSNKLFEAAQNKCLELESKIVELENKTQQLKETQQLLVETQQLLTQARIQLLEAKQLAKTSETDGESKATARFAERMSSLAQERGELRARVEEWKQRAETAESKTVTKQSAVMGREFEDDVAGQLKMAFGHFASVRNCSAETGQLDLDVTTTDGTVVRIDTKAFTKLLPGRDMTKFYRDVDGLANANQKQTGTGADACILFSSGPIPGQGPSCTSSKVERGGIVVYLIARGAVDLMIEAIIETVVHRKQQQQPKPASDTNKGAGEIQKVLYQATKIITQQSLGIDQSSDDFKRLKTQGIASYRGFVDAARLAHAAAPSILTTEVLADLEKLAPISARSTRKPPTGAVVLAKPTKKRKLLATK